MNPKKLLKDKSKNTVKNYISTWKKFQKFTGKNIENTDLEDVNNFLKYLRQNLKDSSVARHAYALKYLLRVIGKYKIANRIEVNYKQNLPHILDRKEITKIFDSIGSKEEYILFHLAYSLALKTSEIANINVKDIDFRNNKLRIKGKNERILPLTKDLTNAIKQYVAEKKLKGTLFTKEKTSVSIVFNGLIRKAGIKVKLRDLRNTKIYEMIESGKDAEKIMKFAGFRSIASLARFFCVKRKPLQVVSIIDLC